MVQIFVGAATGAVERSDGGGGARGRRRGAFGFAGAESGGGAGLAVAAAVVSRDLFLLQPHMR